MNELVYLVTAVAVGVALHSMLEPSNIRNKVKELDAKLEGAPYEPPPALPFGIDAWWKSLVVGMTFTVVPAAVVLGLLVYLVPPVDTCLIATVAVLLGKEAVNTVAINSYHEEIAAVISRVPHRAKSR